MHFMKTVGRYMDRMRQTACLNFLTESFNSLRLKMDYLQMRYVPSWKIMKATYG